MCFWLVVIVTLSIYVASLVTFMSITKTYLPVSSLDELARNPDYTIFVNEGAAQRLFLEVCVNIVTIIY